MFFFLFEFTVLFLARPVRSLIRNVDGCSIVCLPCWISSILLCLGRDFSGTAEIFFRGVGEDATLGPHAHERRTRSGHHVVEWAQGRTFVFSCLLRGKHVGILEPTRRAGQLVAGHPIDHLLCRSRAHNFWGSTRVLFEETLIEIWSAKADHNPVEVKLAKGWVYRAPPRTSRCLCRPNWVALRALVSHLRLPELL